MASSLHREVIWSDFAVLHSLHVWMWPRHFMHKCNTNEMIATAQIKYRCWINGNCFCSLHSVGGGVCAYSCRCTTAERWMYIVHSNHSICAFWYNILVCSDAVQRVSYVCVRVCLVVFAALLWLPSSLLSQNKFMAHSKWKSENKNSPNIRISRRTAADTAAYYSCVYVWKCLFFLFFFFSIELPHRIRWNASGACVCMCPIDVVPSSPSGWGCCCRSNARNNKFIKISDRIRSI